VNALAIHSLIPKGCAGQALTNQYVQTGLSVQTPNYTNYLFQSTAPQNATTNAGTPSREDGSQFDCFEMDMLSSAGRFTSGATSTTGVEVYVGAGTDFNPVFFLNCPCKYKQPLTPTPI